MSKHVALAAHAIINFWWRSAVSLNILRFANGQGVQIVWSCFGIKQAYIFLVLFCLAVVHGSTKRGLYLQVLVCF